MVERPVAHPTRLAGGRRVLGPVRAGEQVELKLPERYYFVDGRPQATFVWSGRALQGELGTRVCGLLFTGELVR